MTPYFVTYVLQPEDPARWIGYYLLAYFASGFVSLPLWLRIVRHVGKKPVYIVSRLMGISGGVMLFSGLGRPLVRPGDLPGTVDPG
jgi:Na+/melibiose symporter-like transporter